MKTIRVYFSTFADININEGDFSSDAEAIEYYEHNSSLVIDEASEQLSNNLAVQEGNSEIL